MYAINPSVITIQEMKSINQIKISAMSIFLNKMPKSGKKKIRLMDINKKRLNLFNSFALMRLIITITDSIKNERAKNNSIIVIKVLPHKFCAKLANDPNRIKAKQIILNLTIVCIILF